MTAKEIDNILRASLTNEYELSNTYIFNWESDYFGISKSNLIYEIEIKLSRSDFFADFKKKRKHEVLEKSKQGKNYITLRDYLYYSYEKPIGYDTFGNKKNNQFRIVKQATKELKIPANIEGRNHKMLYSQVRFKKIFCPHRFYYACPHGLIKKSEIPHYAGLIYVNTASINKVKEAPILHRKELNIQSILLHKFYHLSLNQRIDLKFLREENNRLRSLDNDVRLYAQNITF